jgi:hypothetical protein
MQKHGALLHRLKEERQEGAVSRDAYICFRRRTERMQTRKVVVRKGYLSV